MSHYLKYIFGNSSNLRHIMFESCIFRSRRQFIVNLCYSTRRYLHISKSTTVQNEDIWVMVLDVVSMILNLCPPMHSILHESGRTNSLILNLNFRFWFLHIRKLLDDMLKYQKWVTTTSTSFHLSDCCLLFRIFWFIYWMEHNVKK